MTGTASKHRSENAGTSTRNARTRRLFFRTHQLWLTKILMPGGARGEFTLAKPASKVARFVFGALQGALLVKRTTDDASQLNDVITVMKLQLGARP